jgi:hypothetical protein
VALDHEVAIATALFSGVFSVVPTRRRRYLWAAWWNAPPEEKPFRPPDAASGGARTPDEARALAEAAAGRKLIETDGRWAGAWVRVLRGDPPWPEARPPREATAPVAPPSGSRTWALALLGVAPAEATPEGIKRAFRALALRTHPDRGGDEADFIAAKRAVEVALGVKKRRR